MYARLALQAALWVIVLRPSVAEAAPSEPRLASKEEYLACLIARSSIDTQTARFTDNEARLKERAVKFQAAEVDLALQVKKRAPATQSEIDSYNRAVSARNASAQSLNGQALALQKEQAALNKLIVETNAQCGGLLVTPEVAETAEEAHRNRRKAE